MRACALHALLDTHSECVFARACVHSRLLICMFACVRVDLKVCARTGAYAGVVPLQTYFNWLCMEGSLLALLPKLAMPIHRAAQTAA